MDLRTSASGPGTLTITDSTAGLTALFNINNMGANIYNNEISDSNPSLILSPSVTLPGDLFDEDFQDGYKFMGIQNGLFSATFTVVEN